MAITKEDLQKIKDKLQSDIEAVIAAGKGVIGDATQTYTDLKAQVTPEDVASIATDLILSKVTLPWYVPSFVVKDAILKTVTGLMKKK